MHLGLQVFSRLNFSYKPKRDNVAVHVSTVEIGVGVYLRNYSRKQHEQVITIIDNFS